MHYPIIYYFRYGIFSGIMRELLFCLLCISFLLPARIGRAQSAAICIDADPAHSGSVMEYLDKGKALLRAKQGDAAIWTFYRAMAEAFRHSDTLLFKNAFDPFSKNIANWKSSIDSARAGLLKETLEWCSRLNIKSEYTQLLELLLGDYYQNNMQMETALQYYIRVISFPETMPSALSRLSKTLALYSSVFIWLSVDDVGQASKSMQQLADLAKHSGDIHVQVYENISRSKIHLFHGRGDSHRYYLDKALAVATEGHLSCRCSDVVKAYICESYMANGEGQRVIDTIRQIESRYEVVQKQRVEQGFLPLFTPSILLQCRFLSAWAHFQMDNTALAERELQELLAGHSPQRPLQLTLRLNALQLLTAISVREGAYKKAIGYYEQRIALYQDNSISREKNNSIRFKYQLEKEKSRIKQQLIIEQQKSQLSKNRTIMIASGIGAALLLVVAGSWYKTMKHKQGLQKSQLDNLQKEKQLQVLQSKMEGEEQARRQIARELHDGASSQLLLAKLGLSTLTKSNCLQKGDRALVTDVLQQLDGLSHQLRTTAHNLMPDLILQQGLVFAIAAYLEKLKVSKILAVDFQTFGPPPVLSETVTVQLFRIIQESIQNTIKHAQASKLLVQLNNSADLFSITIEDNGIGFNIEHVAPDSLGIENMIKRMRELGGDLQLDAQPGRGCTVYLEIDLESKYLSNETEIKDHSS